MLFAIPINWLLAAASLAIVVIAHWQFRRAPRADAEVQRRYERRRAEIHRLEDHVGWQLGEPRDHDREAIEIPSTTPERWSTTVGPAHRNPAP